MYGLLGPQFDEFTLANKNHTRKTIAKITRRTRISHPKAGKKNARTINTMKMIIATATHHPGLQPELELLEDHVYQPMST